MLVIFTGCNAEVPQPVEEFVITDDCDVFLPSKLRLSIPFRKKLRRTDSDLRKKRKKTNV